jgi:hypothetical protein
VGIDNNGVFEMTGGTISGNGNATAKYGGGVRLGSFLASGNYPHQATFTMTGGEITGNRASSTITPNTSVNPSTIGTGGGGGVWMSGDTSASNTFTMSDDAVISNNTGGGVAVGLGGKFLMEGGTISGNTSNYGGGVFLFGTATSYFTQFTKTGGTLYGNDGAFNTNNVASSGNESGHAVYYQAAQNPGTGDYYRDATADTDPAGNITVEAKETAGTFSGLVPVPVGP